MSDYSKYRGNIATYYSQVNMAGGWTFDTADTLRRNNLLLAGKFKTGDRDSQGSKKYFYNIIAPACDVAAKFVDLDTKDVIIYSELPNDQYRVWLMSEDFKQWAKENEFGELLNEIGDKYPRTHIVVKKYGKAELDRVPIENLRFDPSISCMDDQTFVYEIMVMSPNEIREMKWNGPDIEEALSYDRHSIQLYECYDRNIEKDGKEWKRTIVCDIGNRTNQGGGIIETPESQINTQGDWVDGCLLHEDEVDELPYYELKWDEVDGRALSMTLPEYLADNQMRKNEIINQQVRASALGSLRVFQTRDNTVQRNLMTDVQDGEILTVNSEITPIPTEARNLPEFNVEHNLWDNNTAQKSFNFEISRGENLPSSTTLGATQILASAVDSYFSKKREKFGLFVRDIILDLLPDFEKYANKEHRVRMTRGSEAIEKMRDLVVSEKVRTALFEHIGRTGSVPSPEEIASETEKVKKAVNEQGDMVFELPANFYKDLKYGIDVLVTGEQKNTQAVQQTMMTTMQLIANPAVMNDERTRTMLFAMLEMAGVSPVSLGLLKEKIQAIPPAMPQGQQQTQMPQPSQAPPTLA